MIFLEGKNYHFFRATVNSLARIQGLPSPFYTFPKSKIKNLPSLSSDPLIIPKFIYSLQWNRIHYESQPIFTPAFIKSLVPKATPFFIALDENGMIQIGGEKNYGHIHLTKTNRTKYGSAKYISIRDLVNPTFSEEEVLQKIEELYFDKKNKSYLYRLVKILYSGLPEEEYKIVSNLFTHELDFAKFLSQSMFSPEIIPLIHGPFLQTFIANFDERIIKYAYTKLSLPLRKVLEKSVSKNKLNMILNGPSLEPKEGDGFMERLESEVYQRFARNIYFEEGIFPTYREEILENGERINFHIEDSKKFNFWMTHEYLHFYGLTKTKLLFKTKTWIDSLRIDWLLSKRDFEVYEFHRLPPDLIIEVPFFPTGNYLVGGGITNDRKVFEFILQWFEH